MKGKIEYNKKYIKSEVCRFIKGFNSEGRRKFGY